MGRVAVVDGDLFKYECAFAGELRSVLVTNEIGFIHEYKTRTEFYGRSRKRDGGELAKINKRDGTNYTAGDFSYTDIQVSEPPSRVVESTKNAVDSALRLSGCKNYIFYMGEGESFRVERSTLLRYKGERASQIKPLLIGHITEFLYKQYSGIEVSGIETDDKVVEVAYRKPDHFVLCVDKDAFSQPVKVFDINTPSRGIVDCTGFGDLFIDKKSKSMKIRGSGRMHLYWQCLAGDAVDNIKPNCFSEMKLGDKGAFDLLKDCKNDKEAFQVLKDTYQKMYPESKEVIGWRGDKITIDYLYVFDEVFDLLRMVRFEGDKVVGREVMKKLVGL